MRAVLGVMALLLRGVPFGELGDLDLDAGVGLLGEGESALRTELAELAEGVTLGTGTFENPFSGRLGFQLKIGSLV